METITILYFIAGATVLICLFKASHIVMKLCRENTELGKKLTLERAKSFKLKRQVEILNIFVKEVEIITQENNYGSTKNIENKLKSAIADIDRLLH